ncbi:10633_t:CDS:2 [Entrophospora sp. SA101]|nr:10633_t:CDS:2 [Entrophospora sp. SA101]
MNKKQKIHENLYILSDSEPEPSEDNEKYNDKQEIITYTCIICKNRYKPSGTLARHLTTEHYSKIGKVQSTLDKFAPKPYAKSEKRYQQLTNTIVDFIVCCQLPFAIVDNPYFTTMLNTFDGCYQVPCRQTIKSEIINNYNNMKKKFLQELSQTKKLSITCDIWRSHSVVRIQQLILQALDDAKITKKLLGITMDNAQSMIAAVRELKIKLENQEFVHQCCAAHILNIAVQHGLQLSDPIIKKVRDFVVKIQQSTRLSDSIRTICQLEKIPELKPDLDVETRWNNNEWQNIENIIQLLEPIFISTEILLSSTYPTIKNCAMANSISFKLKEYWKNVEESTTIATLLDP